MRPSTQQGYRLDSYLLTILHIVWVVLYLFSLVSSVHDHGLKNSWRVVRLGYGFEFTGLISGTDLASRQTEGRYRSAAQTFPENYISVRRVDPI
jgi:hypothetical protein